MNDYLTLDTHELLELTGDNLAVRAHEDMWDDRADQMSALHRRLATYERIAQSLLNYGEPIADYAGQCGCCGMGQPRHGSDWRHAADCPWLLAQRAPDL